MKKYLVGLGLIMMMTFGVKSVDAQGQFINEIVDWNADPNTTGAYNYWGDVSTGTPTVSGYYKADNGLWYAVGAVSGGGGGGGGNDWQCETEEYQEQVCIETEQTCEERCFYNRRGEEICWNDCEGGGTECHMRTATRCRTSCDANSWGGCSVTCGGGIQTNQCGGTQACNTQSCCDANLWSVWSACDGTQNTQGRINACGTVETNNCPRLVGTVYYDSLNNCSGAGWSSGGVAISLDGGAGNAISGTGTFTLLASSASLHSLAVSLPAGYICSTAAGCNTCSRSGIMSPSNNNFFYLTNIREAWWQAEGAGVYAGSMAGGVTIRSELPTSLTKLILPGSGGTSAALMRASGQADLGEGSISSEGWSAITRYRGQRMGYQYFAAKMGVIPLQEDDWFTNNLDDKPSGDVQEFYYQNGDSIVSNPWVVNSGESYVVFIKGNLRINSNITVENGGFLAFVVKGSVTVDPSVTTLQGLYVMDTNFITESDYVLGSVNDVPLDVQGSIVVWGTLSISRNLGAGNSTTPAEKFTHRPDLLANMPQRMKMFLTNWQEVVPGTFGD